MCHAYKKSPKREITKEIKLSWSEKNLGEKENYKWLLKADAIKQEMK